MTNVVYPKVLQHRIENRKVTDFVVKLEVKRDIVARQNTKDTDNSNRLSE